MFFYKIYILNEPRTVNMYYSNKKEVVMKNDLKQMGLFTIGPFLSKILSFILLPLISYFVSLSDYGQYTLFTVLLLYFQTFITLTTEQYYLRAYSSDSAINLRKVLFILFTVNALVMLVCVFLLRLVAWINFSEMLLYVIALLVAYFTMIQDLYSRTFRSNNMGSYYSLSTVIVQVANFVFCIIFVLLMKNVLGLMLGQLFSIIFGTIVTRIIVKNKISVLEEKHVLRLKNIKEILNRSILYSLPLLPGVFLWVIQTSIGRIFLANNNLLLGVYGVGFKFSSITNIFVTSFIVFWEPKIFQLFDAKISDETYINTVKTYRNLYSLLIETIIIGLIIFDPIIMVFMEKSYRSAMYILPLMVLSNYINGYNYFEGFGPQLSEKTHKTIIPLIISVSINIGILFLFGKNNLLIVALSANIGLIVQLVLNARVSNKLVPKINYFNSIIRIILYNCITCMFYINHNYLVVVFLGITVYLVMNLKVIIKYSNAIVSYFKKSRKHNSTIS